MDLIPHQMGMDLSFLAQTERSLPLTFVIDSIVREIKTKLCSDQFEIETGTIESVNYIVIHF